MLNYLNNNKLDIFQEDLRLMAAKQSLNELIWMALNLRAMG